LIDLKIDLVTQSIYFALHVALGGTVQNVLTASSQSREMMEYILRDLDEL